MTFSDAEYIGNRQSVIGRPPKTLFVNVKANPELLKATLTRKQTSGEREREGSRKSDSLPKIVSIEPMRFYASKLYITRADI